MTHLVQREENLQVMKMISEILNVSVSISRLVLAKIYWYLVEGNIKSCIYKFVLFSFFVSEYQYCTYCLWAVLHVYRLGAEINLM